MRIICMIPARSGSKRIPKKNIKDFCDKPIITYPIETAKKSGIFDMIVVYSDDRDIMQLALYNGVEVLERKPVDDNQTLTEAVIEFLKYFDIDYLCILLATAVFVKPEYLDLINKIGANDAMIGFCEYQSPIQQAFGYDKVNQFRLLNKEHEFTRSQDLPKRYYDAGQFYFLSVKSFLEQKRIYMKNIYPVIMDAVDIDTQEDWEKAEVLYKYQKGLI